MSDANVLQRALSPAHWTPAENSASDSGFYRKREEWNSQPGITP
jgi:hypothetical protein